MQPVDPLSGRESLKKTCYSHKISLSPTKWERFSQVNERDLDLDGQLQ